MLLRAAKNIADRAGCGPAARTRHVRNRRHTRRTARGSNVEFEPLGRATATGAIGWKARNSCLNVADRAGCGPAARTRHVLNRRRTRRAARGESGEFQPAGAHAGDRVRQRPDTARAISFLEMALHILESVPRPCPDPGTVLRTSALDPRRYLAPGTVLHILESVQCQHPMGTAPHKE